MNFFKLTFIFSQPRLPCKKTNCCWFSIHARWFRIIGIFYFINLNVENVMQIINITCSTRSFFFNLWIATAWKRQEWEENESTCLVLQAKRCVGFNSLGSLFLILCAREFVCYSLQMWVNSDRWLRLNTFFVVVANLTCFTNVSIVGYTCCNFHSQKLHCRISKREWLSSYYC